MKMHMEFKHNIYGDNDFEPIDVYHEIANPSNSHNCDIKKKHITRKMSIKIYVMKNIN
jgi:hypothetical protein